MNPPIKCLVVDDEPLAVKLMVKHIEQVPQLLFIGQCSNAIEAMAFLKENETDLVFLDIQMPVLTGIDFVKSLHHLPAIIFTTAYRDYAVESYELEVVDYLLKPITFPRFLKAIQKYEGHHSGAMTTEISTSQTYSEIPSWMYVNVNKKHVKIHFAEVLYVESIKDYVRIHTEEESYMTKDTLTDFCLRLPDHFLRVHRSFAVNSHRVTAFTTQDVEIGEKEIPIGSSYKEFVILELKKG